MQRRAGGESRPAAFRAFSDAQGKRERVVRGRRCLLTILLLSTLSLVACNGRESADLGTFTLTDLGGDERAPDVRVVGTDVGTSGDVGADGTPPPPRDGGPPPDVGPPPDTGVSLAPDCPPTGDGWSAWFSKSTSREAIATGPAACGGVRLDRALAWWLRQATTSIDLAVYSLDAKEVADALVAAHAAGVAVRVVVDDDNGAAAPGSRVEALLAAGVPVEDDADGGRLMHHKFAVVDGRRVWFGSANASTYDGAANANHSLIFDAPAFAALLGAEFDRLWAGGFHDDKGAARTLTLAGGAATLYLSPERTGAVEDEIIRLIQGADHEIFVSLFAFTRQPIADALERRCGEVDLVIVLDQQALTSRDAVSLDLCAGGTLLADAVQPTGGLDWPLTLHHKYMVIDGRHPESDPVVVTGSMNWSQNGVFRNDEATLVWHHAAAASVFVQEFAARVEEAGGRLPTP